MLLNQGTIFYTSLVKKLSGIDVSKAIQPSTSVNKIEMARVCIIYTQTTKEGQIEQKNGYSEGTKDNQNKKSIRL